MLVCVIASLCFSVGEGLRLRPFPVSDPAQNEATNSQFSVTAFSLDARSRYGPVDLPTRTQSRGKRYLVEFGNPPAQEWRVFFTPQILLADTSAGASFISILFRFDSTGRAPPDLS